MSTDDFDDIVRGFREERESTGASGEDELLGPAPVVTTLLLVPVREAPILASVLKGAGAQGNVLGTEQGCLVSLTDGSALSAADAASQLSTVLPGADVLLVNRQGGPTEEGQIGCERYRDGTMVDRPVVALVIDMLPAQARKVLLMGESLNTEQGAIDIGSSPDPPEGQQPPFNRVTPPAARQMAGLFDILLTSMVLMGGLLLIMQGAFAEGGISWPRLIFGILATLWCIWRFSPSGRRRIR